MFEVFLRIYLRAESERRTVLRTLKSHKSQTSGENGSDHGQFFGSGTRGVRREAIYLQGHGGGASHLDRVFLDPLAPPTQLDSSPKPHVKKRTELPPKLQQIKALFIPIWTCFSPKKSAHVKSTPCDLLRLAKESTA